MCSCSVRYQYFVTIFVTSAMHCEDYLVKRLVWRECVKHLCFSLRFSSVILDQSLFRQGYWCYFNIFREFLEERLRIFGKDNERSKFEAILIIQTRVITWSHDQNCLKWRPAVNKFTFLSSLPKIYVVFVTKNPWKNVEITQITVTEL